LRPGSIADANDEAQFTEFYTQSLSWAKSNGASWLSVPGNSTCKWWTKAPVIFPCTWSKKTWRK